MPWLVLRRSHGRPGAVRLMLETLGFLGAIVGGLGAFFGWLENRKRRRAEHALAMREANQAALDSMKRGQEIDSELSRLSRDDMVERMRKLRGG